VADACRLTNDDYLLARGSVIGIQKLALARVRTAAMLASLLQ
jgi:hypothetical protein